MGFARLAILSSILFAGCALPEEPRQADAIAIVWGGVYGQTIDPPAIDWMVNCIGPNNEPGVMSGGVCVGGVFHGWHIDLPWVGNYHDSAFAHELLHAKQAKQGIYDYEHTLPEWTTLLPEANDLLTNQGL